MGTKGKGPLGSDGTNVRGRQLQQVLQALGLLTRNAWRMDDLAERMGLEQRTAYRLIESIERAGIPVLAEYDGQSRLRWVERESLERALGLR